MSKTNLHLPVIQNWSCHNCGGCCREHLIEITDKEKRVIEKQQWTAADGISIARPVIQQIGRNRYRLAHQDDGACVFLDDGGLCRIHAKFGESAKPLACRVYPYAVHPAGPNELAVSLRFSCPSVVQNLGPSVASQRAAIVPLSHEIVAGKHRDHDAPLIHNSPPHGVQQANWSDFRRFQTALDDCVADESVDLVVRLMRILAWLELVEQSQFTTIRGAKLDDYLQLVTTAAAKAQPDNDLPIHRPNRMARIMFRLIAAQYARHDTAALVREGIGTRLALLNAALRFTTGLGRIPTLNESASVSRVFDVDKSDAPACSVRFSELEVPCGGRRSDIDELLTRYMRVKIQGIHFCGPAQFQTSLLDGFRGLTLMYPVVMWLARLRAARRGAEQLDLADVQASLATADHNYGYSPALGTTSALKRVSLLSRMKQLTSLLSWYSQ
ncbi:MAG: YkgJ family cysteine cluster protein [Fuerstiella sp.]|nr:YkgJ family cysteine cluster protein [Fuerstiella sp.]